MIKVKQKSAKKSVSFKPTVAIQHIEPRPSKIPVPVQCKQKTPSLLAVVSALLKIALAHVDASDQWYEHDRIKIKRKNALKHNRNLKRSDISRIPSERYGKSYTNYAEQLTQLFVTETYKQVIESGAQYK